MARQFLGNEHDKCGRSLTLVQDAAGVVEVRKGETKEVKVPSNRFWWYCLEDREWTTAPEGTNLVIVTRAPEGRDITWACYKEE
jgi:hypothetical protein